MMRSTTHHCFISWTFENLWTKRFASFNNNNNATRKKNPDYERYKMEWNHTTLIKKNVIFLYAWNRWYSSHVSQAKDCTVSFYEYIAVFMCRFFCIHNKTITATGPILCLAIQLDLLGNIEQNHWIHIYFFVGWFSKWNVSRFKVMGIHIAWMVMQYAVQ